MDTGMIIKAKNIFKQFTAKWRTYAWLKIMHNGAWHDFMEHGRFFYNGDWYEIDEISNGTPRLIETVTQTLNWRTDKVKAGDYELYGGTTVPRYEKDGYSGFIKQYGGYEAPYSDYIIAGGPWLEYRRPIVVFDTSMIADEILEVEKVEFYFKIYAAQRSTSNDNIVGIISLWQYDGTFPPSVDQWGAISNKMFEHSICTHEDFAGDGSGYGKWVDITSAFQSTVQSKGIVPLAIDMADLSCDIDMYEATNALMWYSPALRITYKRYT